MPKLSIKFEDLVLFIDNGSYEMTVYLDKKTGHTVLIMQEEQSAFQRLMYKYPSVETFEAMKTVIEEQKLDAEERTQLLTLAELEFRPDDFIEIPQYDSRFGYQDMENFIETLSDENLREKLFIAIDGQGAFGRFKRVLSSYPQERERWFRFKEQQQRKFITRWLTDEAIDYDLV